MTDKQTEALKLALEALERCGSESYAIEREAITAIREALAQSRSDEEQPAQQEPWEHLKAYGYAPGGYMMTCRGCNTTVIGVDKRASRCKPCAIKAFKAQQQEPWADECRIELVNAIHFLASDFENALGAFGGDTEARRKAEGDIAHARSIASRWNWNGASTPAQRKPLTDEQLLHFVDIHVGAPSIAYPLDNSDWITFARAIEAAHGIKGDA